MPKRVTAKVSSIALFILTLTVSLDMSAQGVTRKFPPTKVYLRENTFGKSMESPLDSLLEKEFGRGTIRLEKPGLLSIWQEFLLNGGYFQSKKIKFEDCLLCWDDEIQIEMDSFIEEYMEPDGSFFDHKVSFTLKITVRYTGNGLFDKDRSFTFIEKGKIGYFDWKFDPIELDSIYNPQKPLPSFE